MTRFSLLFLAVSLVPVPALSQDQIRPAVIAVEAQIIELPETATFNGMLDANLRVDLVPQVGGLISKIGFSAGDTVTQGQVLFTIDPGIYAAAVTEAEGALRSAQAQHELAQIERDRQAELVSRQAAANATLQLAEATLATREGEVMRATAALDRARTNLSYTRITAPFDGRIGNPSADMGALVGPQTGVLATLVQLDPIHVEFQVPTATLRTYLERVERGEASRDAAVSLTLANGRVYSRMGDLDFVDSRVSQGTDSVKVRARFDNPDADLLDGELVRVTLSYDKPAGELAVPGQAVQRDVQGPFVLVVGEGDVVVIRRISVLRSTDGFAVIGEGLTPGDRVITEGINKVRPGIAVDAVAPAQGG